MKTTMTIKTIATGSTGNCFLISDGASEILIECGIPYRKIQEGCGFRVSGLDGVLISHEHNDHSHAVKGLLSAGIPIFTSAGTAEVLNISGYNVNVIKAGERFEVGGFLGISFQTQHDAAEPLGFLIKSKTTGESLVFATDTYYIANRFRNVTYFMIESNFIASELRESDTNSELMKRIMTSHMSLEQCIEFLRNQDLSKTKAIYLIHLSADRGDAREMRRAVARATGKMILVAGMDK